MLTTAECLAKEQGLEWAFCDTDSMAFANYHGIDPKLFDSKVKEICRWFDPLNPYGDGLPLLKLENYEENNPLYCWAISAKRYALFNIAPDNTPVIRKASMHGLGQYVDPYGNDYIHAGSRITEKQIKETGLKRWHLDIWYNILVHALDGNRLDFNPAAADEFKIPAACRYGVTSPNIMRWLGRYNTLKGQPKPLPYQIRPFGFILAYRPKDEDESIVLEKGSAGFIDADQYTPRILSPYSKNIGEAVKKCFDCNNPDAVVRISQLKTLQEELSDYNLRPESKFLKGRPFESGLTERRHIEISAVHYIGKEANLVDEQTYLGAMPEAQITYGFGKAQREVMFKEICEAITTYGVLRFAKIMQISRQHIQDILKGRCKPSNQMLLALHAAIKPVEQTYAHEIAFEQSVLIQAREIIKTGKMTITALANAIQNDASYFAKIISGKRNISKIAAKNLAVFLSENI